MLTVLETNVLVSGVLSENGPPGWIVDLVLAGEVQLAFDSRILEEYRDVLRRPKLRLPEHAVDALISAIQSFGLEVTVLPWQYELPDPDDEPFLAVAGKLGAILVTGNMRHYPKRVRAGARVMTPREFLNHLR